MKRECDGFEKSIWERARSGAELPEKVRRHVESCPECARALAEARRLSGPLLDAGRVEDSPDCRAAVMAAISSEPRRRLAPAWAYACAAVLVAAVVGLATMAHRPLNEARIPIVKRSVRAVVERNVSGTDKAANAPRVSPEGKPGIAATAEVALHKTHRHHAYKHERIALRYPSPSAQHPSPITQQPTPVAQQPPPEPRVVAAVAVTWPTDEERKEDSYSYIERDAETGETTTCSVKRSGDRVEIYIESTAGGEELPVKGSIQNESKVNA